MRMEFPYAKPDYTGAASVDHRGLQALIYQYDALVKATKDLLVHLDPSLPETKNLRAVLVDCMVLEPPYGPPGLDMAMIMLDEKIRLREEGG
jgi:hypothetical protein